jgi:hypothetical protein
MPRVGVEITRYIYNAIRDEWGGATLRRHARTMNYILLHTGRRGHAHDRSEGK